MVYRIAGVYRRRIDEIRPSFQDAELIEDADETHLRIAGDPGADISATPAGFYIHWWSEKAGFAPEQATRDKLFAKMATWIAELRDDTMYADVSRKSGTLIVGRRRLVPFAADPDLSARLIREGLGEVTALRDRVSALLTEKLAQ